MLSFNRLGQVGRLGNQMFQYAALMAIADAHGYDFCIPPSRAENLHTEHQLFEAFALPRLKVLGWNRTSKVKQPGTFAFDRDYVEGMEDGSDLLGYFQSEKYFLGKDAMVRDEFTFHAEIREHCKKLLNLAGGRAVSLHVRRGDYVSLAADFPPCDVSYYAEALRLVPPDLPVIVFSDDIDWCKTQALFEDERFIFSSGNHNTVDLCLMTFCQHHIIANSSFSWWGAWLGRNPEKIVIAPKRWFGGAGFTAGHDVSDLLPPGWITV